MINRFTTLFFTSAISLLGLINPAQGFDKIENDEWMLFPGYGFNMHETDFKKKERIVIASVKNGAQIHNITVPTYNKTIISDVKNFCKLRKKLGKPNMVWETIMKRFKKNYRNISKNKKERIIISHEAFRYLVLVENVSYKVYCPKYIDDLNKNIGLNQMFWKMINKLENEFN